MLNMSLFSQLLQVIPRSLFNRLVQEFKTEYRSKGFKSWDQFVAMLFCQFADAQSLREISYGLQSCEGKLSHLGISAPAHSTLANANKVRSWELFESLFYTLLKHIQGNLDLRSRRALSIPNKLYSLDSTTIDLCLSLYDWAKFRSRKGAIKLHMRLDHDGYLPDFALVTEGKTNDSKAAWDIPFEAESITVFDRGYNDFSLYWHIHQKGAFFVTRMRTNCQFEVLQTEQFDHPDLISDSIIRFTGTKSSEHYGDNIRLVKVRSLDGETIGFLTNNRDLSAEAISEIYRERWNIELFFKAIKQNLKIKTFVGTSKNAVMTQVYTALISILLLKYLQLKSTFGWSLSNLVALLRMNLFVQKNLWEWIDNPFGQPPDSGEVDAVQISLQFGQHVSQQGGRI